MRKKKQKYYCKRFENLPEDMVGFKKKCKKYGKFFFEIHI